MPPPSQLSIATQVVMRLVKEEKSYRKELETQKASVERLKASLLNGASGDGNAEFMLRQEVS
jgi:tubulin-specific chaperone A